MSSSAWCRDDRPLSTESGLTPGARPRAGRWKAGTTVFASIHQQQPGRSRELAVAEWRARVNLEVAALSAGQLWEAGGRCVTPLRSNSAAAPLQIFGARSAGMAAVRAATADLTGPHTFGASRLLRCPFSLADPSWPCDFKLLVVSAVRAGFCARVAERLLIAMTRTFAVATGQGKGDENEHQTGQPHDELLRAATIDQRAQARYGGDDRGTTRAIVVRTTHCWAIWPGPPERS